MSFATFKEKTTSDKVVLCEVDIGKAWSNWINYRSGIWHRKFYTYRANVPLRFGFGNFGHGNFGYNGIHTCGYNIRPVNIGSCKVGGTLYIEKTTLEDCINNESSFYYDYNTSVFYIHCLNNNNPRQYLVIVGYTLGLSNKAIHINNAFYESRLTGLPSISKSKDALYFGLISFDGGALTFNNRDGFFDKITDDYIFGQQVVIKYGGDALTYAQYRTVFKGYIQSLDIDYEKIVVRIADDRKKLSRALPTTKFNKTDYANLDDDDVGKPIPIAYGECYHCPVVCTNKGAGSTAYTFKVCDISNHTSGIESIDKVYIDEQEATVKSTNTTDASFILDVGVYDPTSDQEGQEVTCDFAGLLDGSGSLDDNALDIIEDILNTYLSISYTTDYYDTTAWTTAKSDALNVGIYINDEISVIDIIQKISLSTFGNFIIKDDGLYTYKIFDAGTTASKTIKKEEYLADPVVKYDGTEYLSSCKIGYTHDYGENDYRWYNENTNESAIYQKYGRYQHKNFETLIVTTSEANSLGTSIMDYMDEVHGMVSSMTGIQNIELEIGDVVNFEVDRVSKTWMDDVKVEVVGIKKNLIEGTVDLKGRII